MSFWQNAKVLITGANGFAGSSACRRLIERDAKVYALVRDSSALLNLRDIAPKLNIVYGDVRYLETALEATRGMDYVLNFAAKVNIEETRKNPSETLRTNINGTLNMANACIKNQVKRLVHISTCHIYGNTPESDLPITEETMPHPLDVYSISKYAAELLVRNTCSDNLDIVITRAFNHYGPGQTGDFFVAKVIRQLLNDVAPTLGSNKPTRDYSYVDDIALGYVLACERGKRGQIYHFSSGSEISIGEMYDKIRNIMGKPNVKAVWQSARANDMSRSFGKYEKAKLELGWEPNTPLEEGLRKTVDWWKHNSSLVN
jgi:nucleoside-diphosphate-sugar epimerase